MKSDMTFLTLLEDPECNADDRQGLEVRRRKAYGVGKLVRNYKLEVTQELLKLL